MGESTNALLWFGYCSDSEEGLPESVLRRMAKKAVVDDDDLMADIEKLLKPLNVELITHCSHMMPMYGLGHTESLHEVRRGYPEEVETREGNIPERWEHELKRAAAAIGWPVDEEPKYWLASYLG